MADDIHFDGDANPGEAKFPSHTPITEEAKVAAAKREQEARARDERAKEVRNPRLSLRSRREIQDILGLDPSGDEESKGRSV